MNLGDFEFIKHKPEYDDYWFAIHGESEIYLTNKHMQQSLVSVVEVVYSRKTDELGIKLVFPFNFEVILVNDTDLKEIIINKIRMLKDYDD